MAAADEMVRPVKVQNNRTTFVLGNETCDWSTDAKDAFGWKLDAATLEDNKAAGKLAAKQRVTSVHLGDTATDYSTDYNDAFHDVKDVLSARPPPVQRDLRRTNFVLGTEKCDFETDYSAGFTGAAPAVEISTRERMESKRVMAEVRKTHFVLGEAEADWGTTMSSAQAEGFKVDPEERERQREELAEFKKELGRLHFSLGTETETNYTTTTSMPPVDTKAATTKAVKKNTHGTNFVLGDEEPDYRSQSMVMTGQTRVKLDEPYVPRRDGSWKKTILKQASSKFV